MKARDTYVAESTKTINKLKREVRHWKTETKLKDEFRRSAESRIRDLVAERNNLQRTLNVTDKELSETRQGLAAALSDSANKRLAVMEETKFANHQLKVVRAAFQRFRKAVGDAMVDAAEPVVLKDGA